MSEGKEDKTPNLAGWAAIIGAIAALITAIGFPDLVKRFFPNEPSSEPISSPSPQVTPSVEEPNPVIPPSLAPLDSSVAPLPSSTPTASPSSSSISTPTPLPTENIDTPSPSTNAATLIDWTDTVNNLNLRQSIGQRFSFRCPPSQAPITRLYGTDIYTGHSSICEAAVHSGVFTQDQGGVVTIEVGGKQQSFTGSQQFGVLSKGQGAYYSSFVIIH